ncbi:MAG: sigma-70 family RNA polymerase sigma factor [Planctomycetes bacterium]|nr:sigma-70 family RNA polymerase sigma factor [Planctomycetota bacterium]
MNPSDSAPSLLSETRWLERMARSLCGDPHQAADLAQDAWLLAQRAPQAPANRRAWLVGMLRKLVAKTHRGERRRQRRELARSGPEPERSTADLLARTEQHQRLLAHVQALPEHYRVPLLLRFFDELPPRAIADRLQLPVATVNTRLQRALEQLRGRLDQEHPHGRAGWVAALSWRPDRTSLPMAPTTAGPWLRRLALGAFAAITSVAVVWWANRSPSAPLPQPSLATAEPMRPTAPPTLDSRPARSDAATPPTPNPIGQHLHGQVLDENGWPVAGATIHIAPHLGIAWQPDRELVELQAGPSTTLAATSDRDGGFRCVTPRDAIEVRAELPGHVTAWAGIWRPDQELPPRVVLAPSRPFAARVVDDRGAPVGGAEAIVQLLDGPGPERFGNGRGLHALHWRTTSTADGAFEFQTLPDVPGAVLQITAPGHDRVQLPLASIRAGEVVLPRWVQALRGRVLDAQGRPLADTTVAAGSAVTTTDAEGHYALPGTAGPLQAAAAGLRPTTFAAPAADGATWILDAPALTVSGTLRAATGAALRGWEIALADPTVVGDSRQHVVLEAVAASHGRVVHRVHTDIDGAFALGGLAQRSYRLRCVAPDTAAWFETEPIEPGAGIVIRTPPDLLLDSFVLRLRTPTHAPVAGAVVTVQGPGYVVPLPDGAHREVLFAHGASGITAADGRVQLQGVPRRGVRLRVSHRELGVQTVAIEQAIADAGQLQLPRHGEVAVRCADPDAALWIELLDAQGAPLSVPSHAGIAQRSERRWLLQRGRSPMLSAPETAVQLRLGLADGRTRLHPLTVQPGTTVLLDL